MIDIKRFEEVVFSVFYVLSGGLCIVGFGLMIFLYPIDRHCGGVVSKNTNYVGLCRWYNGKYLMGYEEMQRECDKLFFVE